MEVEELPRIVNEKSKETGQNTGRKKRIPALTESVRIQLSDRIDRSVESIKLSYRYKIQRGNFVKDLDTVFPELTFDSLASNKDKFLREFAQNHGISNPDESYIEPTIYTEGDNALVFFYLV